MRHLTLLLEPSDLKRGRGLSNQCALVRVFATSSNTRNGHHRRSQATALDCPRATQSCSQLEPLVHKPTCLSFARERQKEEPESRIDHPTFTHRHPIPCFRPTHVPCLFLDVLSSPCLGCPCFPDRPRCFPVEQHSLARTHCNKSAMSCRLILQLEPSSKWLSVTTTMAVAATKETLSQVA